MTPTSEAVATSGPRPHVPAPTPRGPVSRALLGLLVEEDRDTARSLTDAFARATDLALSETRDVLTDEDLQLTLFLLYLLHYGPGEYVRGDWEWDPQLLAIRATIEEAVERALRGRVPMPENLPTDGVGTSALLFEMTAGAAHPTLAKWLSRNAEPSLLQEFLIHRSIYTLREADPHSWAIPRLRGRAKAALVEIQSDEYGGGRPDLVHAEIFAGTMRALGLDERPEAYLDRVPATTLLPVNVMSLFGLHRRLRGAIVGHLAAFEMTSSIPNRHYSQAFARAGHGSDVTWYFDEHVEADAVHEQIAGRDLAGSLVESDHALLGDVIFGAAACLFLDDLAGEHMLAAWQDGRSSLRTPTDSTGR